MGGDAQVGQQKGTLQPGESEIDTNKEAIPIVEERLRVGKRDTNLGRVRVRSYLVEEPAEEQVTLRQERVRVERRPVDKELTGKRGRIPGPRHRSRRACGRSGGLQRSSGDGRDHAAQGSGRANGDRVGHCTSHRS